MLPLPNRATCKRGRPVYAKTGITLALGAPLARKRTLADTILHADNFQIVFGCKIFVEINLEYQLAGGIGPRQ